MSAAGSGGNYVMTFMPSEELAGSAEDLRLLRVIIFAEKSWLQAAQPAGFMSNDSLKIQTLFMNRASSGNTSGEWRRRVILQFLFLFGVWVMYLYYTFIT